MKRVFVINERNRRHIAEQVANLPTDYEIRCAPKRRSTDQNSAMWGMLSDIAKQVVWHGRQLDAESWKHIFSSSLKKQDVVPNLDGTGFVVMGASTSSMSKREMSDLLELIASFGAQHDVKFSE